MGKENTAAFEPSQFREKFMLGELQGKLLNLASDISGISYRENSIWKKIISGDSVQVDQKYGKSFNFRPIAKHIFTLNELPVIADRSWGFRRRIIAVSFNRKFRDSEADRDLEDKLFKERSGIFNWAIAGLKRVLKKEKIYQTRQTKEDTRFFLKGADPILGFVGGKCILGRQYLVEKRKLHRAFLDFCRESRRPAISDRAFYEQLLNGHPEIKKVRPKGGARFFKGIALRK